SNLSYHWNITGVTDMFDANLSLVIPSPGVYLLSVGIYNAISRKDNNTIIYAEDQLTGLTLAAPDSPVNTPVIFTFSLSGGSNYTCTLDYGDSTPILTLADTDVSVGAPHAWPYTYTSVGVYDVKTVCINNVSSVNVTFNLNIQEIILNLRLARLGAPTNEIFSVGWLLDSGSSVQFNVTLNNAPLTIDTSTSDPSIYRWKSTLLPGKPAAGYPYSIQAWNRISSLNISGIFKVMDKIVNPTFRSNLNNVTTDDVVTFTVDVSKGSDVTVIIEYFDGSSNDTFLPIPEGVAWPGTKYVNHSFINGCNCPVTATIFNAAGSFTLVIKVLVKVGFSTISWELPMEQYYLYEPPASISFMFNSTTTARPTDPTIEINWGDQSPKIIQHSITIGSPGYRQVSLLTCSYDLDDTLDYNINITMYNLLGFKSFIHTAIVVEKLMNPVIDVLFDKAPLNKPYKIIFKMYRGDQGKLTNITWDFGDGQQPIVTERQGSGENGSDNMTVTYTTLGYKHVTITAMAPLNQLVSATKIIDVIQGVDAEYVNVTATINVQLGTPTNFTVSYTGSQFPSSPLVIFDYYGDGSTVNGPFSFTNPTTNQHTYSTSGQYNAKVIVKNNASLVETLIVVGAYSDFINLKVLVTYPSQQIGAITQNTTGMGANKAQFPLDASITFTLTDDSGGNNVH
ncbi:hypothetical protein Btru_024720, partial [Bulinus truncatus]